MRGPSRPKPKHGMRALAFALAAAVLLVFALRCIAVGRPEGGQRLRASSLEETARQEIVRRWLRDVPACLENDLTALDRRLATMEQAFRLELEQSRVRPSSLGLAVRTAWQGAQCSKSFMVLQKSSSGGASSVTPVDKWRERAEAAESSFFSRLRALRVRQRWAVVTRAAPQLLRETTCLLDLLQDAPPSVRREQEHLLERLKESLDNIDNVQP